MPELVAVTFTGLSKWSTLNGLWALCEREGRAPARTYIFHPSAMDSEAREARAMVEGLVRSSGGGHVLDITTGDEDATEFRQRLAEILQRERRLGAEVAIDVTPARKLFAISAATLPEINLAKSVSYLYIDGLERSDSPYPLIPLRRQRLMELKGVVL